MSAPNYTSSSLFGVEAALRAGLAKTARRVELVGADLRMLGLNDGLPYLPDAVYHLFIRKNVINPLTREVYGHAHGKPGSDSQCLGVRAAGVIPVNKPHAAIGLVAQKVLVFPFKPLRDKRE